MLNANFGKEIKERLVQAIRPAALVVFAPSVNLFADALTTSAIVFLEKGRPTNAFSWLKRADSLQEAEAVVEKLCAGGMKLAGNDGFELTTLNPSEKWLNLLFNDAAQPDTALFQKRVGDYFDCRRGIATGANDYFCLSRAEMRHHHLTEAHVEPCITKAVDADGLVFTRKKFDALVADDRRCFLLNPTRNGQSLARYLKLGEERGIPKRHLPSHRPVWYLPENRAVADILVAVFSRESAKFILNASGAKNLTCFHGLYGKPGCEALPPLMTLFLNSSDGRGAFKEANRFYGDGLNKLEPKDVEDMPCPAMPLLSQVEAEELTRALAELEKLSLNERTPRIDELAARYFVATNFQPIDLPRYRCIKRKAATLGDDIRIVPSKFRDAMFCGKSRHRSGASNLCSAGAGNHDGRLLLTFLRRLNREPGATSNYREDIQEVDREHRVEEYLTITLRHVMPLQPAIHDQKIFDFHSETRRLCPITHRSIREEF